MGFYKYLRQSWQKLSDEEIKSRLISYRREGSFVRVERPTRLDRAHSLGYKAKQGFLVVRARIGKGTRKREKPAGGRKPIHAGMTGISPKQSLQHIAEMRVARHYPNCEVLNSYYLAEDGRHKWFEVILVDKGHPTIKADRNLRWLQNPANRRRVFRGLTSSGKKSRMLRGRGKGFERRNKPWKR